MNFTAQWISSQCNTAGQYDLLQYRTLQSNGSTLKLTWKEISSICSISLAVGCRIKCIMVCTTLIHSPWWGCTPCIGLCSACETLDWPGVLMNRSTSIRTSQLLADPPYCLLLWGAIRNNTFCCTCATALYRLFNYLQKNQYSGHPPHICAYVDYCPYECVHLEGHTCNSSTITLVSSISIFTLHIPVWIWLQKHIE